MSESSRIPARYIAALVERFIQQGVDMSSAFNQVGGSLAQLSGVGATMTTVELDHLIQAIFDCPGFRPSMVVQAGLRLDLMDHEILGFAMLNSPTIHYAWNLNAQFFKLIVPSFKMEYRLEAQQALLRYTPLHPLSYLSLAVHFEAIASITHANVKELTRNNPPNYDIYFSTQQPSHKKVFSRLTAAKVHFEASSSPLLQIVFPAEIVQRALPTADPHALAIAEQRCRTQLATYVSEGRLADWVRMMLRESHDKLPSLPDLAATLNITAKTLERYLRKENVGFRQLANEIKSERAIALLKQGQGVTHIAYTLGYTNVVNFSRAFKKIHGLSPSAYQLASAE
jgi:AraC-like DNA-binding protein